MPALHLSIPNYRGWVESPHYTSMILFAHQLGMRKRSFNWIAPSYTIVSVARQMAVNQALADPECQILAFIDDDMTFTGQDFFALENQMIDEDLDYITGLCFKNSIPTCPCIFGHADGEEEFNTKKPWWAFMTDYPKDQRFEIYASGLAFALISRRCLEKIVAMDDGVWGDGLARFNSYSHFHMAHPLVHNEDLAFCLKARQAGIKLWCDSRVKIGHIAKDRPIINEEIYKMHIGSVDYAMNTPRMMPVSEDMTWRVRPVHQPQPKLVEVA